MPIDIHQAEDMQIDRGAILRKTEQNYPLN